MIFISHSKKDLKLVNYLVDLLDTGCDVPRKDIICTSIEDLGVPNGEDFLSYLKQKLDNTSLKILVITESYCKSDFCKYELGAAWIKKLHLFPLIVPPMTINKVRKNIALLTNAQLAMINKSSSLDMLRDRIVSIHRTKGSTANWNIKRDAFLSNIKPIMKKVNIKASQAVTSDKSSGTLFNNINNRQESDKPIILQRITSIPVGGISLFLPNYFPSISSLKTTLAPYEYLQVLYMLHYPNFLISAYDITNIEAKTKGKKDKIREQFGSLITNSIKNQQIILLDSGYFESSGKNDIHWTHSEYAKVLKLYNYSLAFSFDKPNDRPRKKTGKVQETVNEIEHKWLEDNSTLEKSAIPAGSATGSIIPIVHGEPKAIPEIFKGVAERTHPVMIAVPERELGDGILAVSETIAKIRKRLDETGQYYPIHLLGTGHPLSILTYVFAGADSFDGLEWCQTAIDNQTSLSYHFNHFDFFKYQFDNNKYPYTVGTLNQNLIFYQKWMERIQKAIIDGNLSIMLEQYLPNQFLHDLKEKLLETI
jgi:queuine/archaeosine tRNA-ribosyltransferase